MFKEIGFPKLISFRDYYEIPDRVLLFFIKRELLFMIRAEADGILWFLISTLEALYWALCLETLFMDGGLL